MDRAIRNILEDQFPGYSAILTARGSAALYLALREIHRTRGPGEVILPATVCPAVPLVVIYAGFIPRFCDVDAKTFGATLRTIEPVVNRKTQALIAVHLFGKGLDLPKISAFARDKDLVLIEDLAQSIGGSIGNRKLGSYGDYSFLSFGDTKIVGGPGGALLVRDPDRLKGLHAALKSLPSGLPPAAWHETERSLRNLTHGIFDLMRAQTLKFPIPPFRGLIGGYRRLHLYRQPLSAESSRAVLAGLADLSKERARRYENYLAYLKQLAPRIVSVRFEKTEMVWRLPILMKSHEQQLEAIRRVRKIGGLISNHYFPVSVLFGDHSCRTANRIGLSAINLWTDQKANRKIIPQICREINSVRGIK